MVVLVVVEVVVVVDLGGKFLCVCISGVSKFQHRVKQACGGEPFRMSVEGSPAIIVAIVVVALLVAMAIMNATGLLISVYVFWLEYFSTPVLEKKKVTFLSRALRRVRLLIFRMFVCMSAGLSAGVVTSSSFTPCDIGHETAYHTHTHTHTRACAQHTV